MWRENMLRTYSQGISPVFLLLKSPYDHHARMVIFETVLTIIIMATCATVQLFDHATVQAQDTPSTDVIATTPQVLGVQTDRNEAAMQVATVAVPKAPRPSTPACQANTTYGVPGDLDLGNYSEGLTIVRSAPQYYQVYGDDWATLRAQIAACGPQHEYAADASYSLNWSYAFRADETGQCRVVAAQVGVRSAMLLPFREVTGDETTGLLTNWQSFSSALRNHENGHAALTEQYASRLLTQLQSYPPDDCYTMSSRVEAIAESVAAQLSSAQRQYDASTNHGATQGAIF